MKHIIIKEWFEKTFTKFATDMKNSDHAYDENTPNPYHMEGDVWTHTMMVLEEASKLTDKEEILLAALLHDVGKPKSREVVPETKRVRFFSHESISTVLSIEILLKYREEVNESINLIRVLELINWHSDFHQISQEKGLSKKQKIMLGQKYGDTELFEDMFLMSMSDNLGRIHETLTKEDTITRFEYIRKEYEAIQKELQESPSQEVNKKSKIQMLIGIPNAGKSTHINEELKKGEKVILSFDNMIMEKYPDLNYSDAFKKAMETKGTKEDNWKEFERRFKEELKISFNEGKEVIVDKTNLTKKSRNRVLSNAPKTIKREAIMFLTTLPTLLERNAKRAEETGKYIPMGVMENFIKSFTMPDNSEFDEIFFVVEERIVKTPKQDQKETKDKKITQ